MFVKFNNKIYNIQCIRCIRVTKSKEEFPKYGIIIDGMMQDELDIEWYESVNQCHKRFRQLQNNLGAEDVWISGCKDE